MTDITPVLSHLWTDNSCVLKFFLHFWDAGGRGSSIYVCTLYCSVCGSYSLCFATIVHEGHNFLHTTGCPAEMTLQPVLYPKYNNYILVKLFYNNAESFRGNTRFKHNQSEWRSTMFSSSKTFTMHRHLRVDGQGMSQQAYGNEQMRFWYILSPRYPQAHDHSPSWT